MIYTAADVEAHQRRTLGVVVCTCTKGRGVEGMREEATGHSVTCPRSLMGRGLCAPGEIVPLVSERVSRRALRKHREPNKTEAEYGRILDSRCRRGEIFSYGFEGITLRWADMEYTPDFHVCEPFDKKRTDTVISEIVPMIHVFIEIKGGHRWEDSIVKWKAFARGKPFPWARFELYQKEGGQWHRLG